MEHSFAWSFLSKVKTDPQVGLGRLRKDQTDTLSLASMKSEVKVYDNSRGDNDKIGRI